VSDSSVIREFLVKLGFKADEQQLQNFEKGIDRATKAVVGLAAAIEVTAVAVAAGVARFASNLEALYFASIRTNTAAANLQAYDLAVQNFGGTAGEATASIEGLAAALRKNPGNEGVLSRPRRQRAQREGRTARSVRGDGRSRQGTRLRKAAVHLCSSTRRCSASTSARCSQCETANSRRSSDGSRSS
jgi:hypothetical protein